MAHSIRYLPSAKKKLDALPGNVQKPILAAVGKLKDNPRPPGCKKLKGRDAYRIRSGVYRIVYEVFDDVLLVMIIRVAHRSEVYRA